MEFVVDIIIVLLAIGVVAGVVALFITILPYILGGAAIIGCILLVAAIISDSADKDSHIDYNQTVSHSHTQRNSFNGYHNSAEEAFHELAVAMVQIKSAAVNLSNLRPEMDSALVVAANISREMFGSDYIITVTSGNDSDEHCQNSAHYSGAAVDLRTKDISNTAMRRDFAERLQESLGNRFKVLFESQGQANEHLHVQLNSHHFAAR